MGFNLHSDAVTNFNEKAEMLLKELVVRPASKYPKKTTFNPKFYIAAQIAETDLIGDIKRSDLNRDGNEVGLVYLHKGMEIGLFDEGYINLIKLSQNMQKLKELYSVVSVSFLKDNIFKWLKYRYVGDISISMISYLSDIYEKEVDDYEIWIPIPGISVQSEFKIGKIILKPISNETIDRWFVNWDEKTKMDHVNNEQRELQGYAAATIQLRAEPVRAKEVAVSESEMAISILRIFTPENLSPNMLSYCSLSGNQKLERCKYFLVKNEHIIKITNGFVDKNVYDAIVFSDEIFSMIYNLGLGILSEVLCTENRSRFQDQVLTSLFLYSRNSLERDISDKLVYILVSLESILLKDSNEPIMQNIGDRMAFLIGTPEKRKEIAQNVKEIYGLRSSFIHHGKDLSFENIATMKIFMHNSFKLNLYLINNIYKFNDKSELIEYVDNIKYGVA